MDMQQIEQQTKHYATARQDLRDRVLALEDAVNKLKKKELPGIKRAVEDAAHCQEKLRSMIADSPDLFKRPRSIIIYGIKVGFQKAKGTLSWADDSAVVKAIKRLFPDGWDGYVKVTEKPLKEPLATLPANDLKKLGITVSQDTDEVLIKSTENDIDKLVTALLKGSDDAVAED